MVQTATILLTMWRWLPPAQKRRALLLARRHGPRLVRTAMKRGHRRKRR
jgi:hypothetical protein